MSTQLHAATVNSDDYIQVRRPADGTDLERIPIDPPQRVQEAAAALRAAQPAWEALPFAERARWLGRMRDWLMDNSPRVVALMQAEAGKVRAESALELTWCCDIINYYSERGAALLADQAVTPHLPLMLNKRLKVLRRPYPLVGVIGPWNFPVVLTFGDAVPALLAGAAVLIKPSEVTPIALREVIRGWRDEVGAPPVLDAVFGVGQTGGALVDAVDMIHFTGSVRTGKLVAQRAADKLIPASLELGGKDPLLVLRDANVERAASCAAWGAFVNAGQVCISIERAYVEEPVYDEFVRRVTDKVKALRQGSDGPHVGVDVGTMISPAQLRIVEDHVDDALAKGARALTGGRRAQRPGDWYEPTVLVDVDHSMKIMTEETFGPVLPIMKVRDADEAVRLANDSPYGLAATVCCGSARRGEQIARRLEAGTVNINDALVGAMCIDVPMGGWKHSGIGARSGPYGMLKYTRAMTVTSPRFFTPDSELAWFPYTPKKTGMAERLYRFFNARGLRSRLGR
jgi:acyl-CoA reductase-like NAD-dependent aldehyde dehydrogenase